MNETKPSWKPGKKDALFLGIVFLVIIFLVLGSHERTTKPTPNDDVHRTATSHEVCMQCHGVDGVAPQPVGHAASVQCFQCHAQPKDWQGAGK